MSKHCLLILLLLLSTAQAFASDPAPGEEPPQLTPEGLKSAMEDAQKEYEAALKKAAPSPTREKPADIKQLNDLVSRLTRATKIEKGTLLEDLAQEVELLKNKVVLERTTLLATQSPRKVTVRGAKTIYNYREEAIYELQSALEHITDIQLQAGETLTTAPTAGDTVRWNIGVMKSGLAPNEVTHIIVKPLDEDIETNLILTTDRHVYQLKLKSGAVHMPAIAWNYPADHSQEILDAMKKQQSEEPTLRPEDLRFTYKISGDDYNWKPVRVFDDGKKTFIQMPPNLHVTDAPALFLLEDDDEPMLVNYRVKGDFYIVDRLFSKAELRVGPKRQVTICFDDGHSWLWRVFH